MATTIRTRYQGPRGYRGSVIIARGAGRQVTIGYSDALSSQSNHAQAAHALAGRLGLSGALHTSDATDDPAVYVHTVSA